jgi:hypothetical protein
MTTKTAPPIWEPAKVNEITAVFFSGHLMLTAKGDKPTPCYEVQIFKSPLPVEPPTYSVEWRRGPGICPDVVTPYEVTTIDYIGTYRPFVDVITADGTKKVPVENRDADATPSGVDKKFVTTPRTATGYSDSFSFEDAFRNAIAQLPPLFPDQLQHFVVTETGALVGGFVGQRRLFVTVRTP